MSDTSLVELFAPLREPAALRALAPLAALGLGLLLFLACDVVARLRALGGLVFAGSIAAALAAELYVLALPGAPGAVLEGTFVASRATALWGILFLLGTLCAWMHGQGYYRARPSRPFRSEHDALLLAAPIGMMLMVGAGDWIVFFVGLELLSIPLYALCAFERTRAGSVEAGIKYFLLGSFSSALFLYGAALVYAATGTLSIGELFTHEQPSDLCVAGLALVAASLFFKVSVFPFHLWTPDVYQGSPTPVTALMATGTKAAAFGFLVVQLAPLLPARAATSVALLALVTMAVGNLGALVQGELKRLLAYSSIAHAGTLLLLVAAGMRAEGGADALAGVSAALYYLAGYLFTAMGAFGLVALLESEGRSTRLEDLSGLWRERPLVAGLLALFLLSLGGIPATAGFLGKWFVFAVLVREGLWSWVVPAALLSVVALAYYLRVIVALFMQEPRPEPQPACRAAQGPAGLATGLCAAFVLALGVFPRLFLDLLAP